MSRFSPVVFRIGLSMAIVLQTSCASAPSTQKHDGQWQPLFNGRDLEGWTPKINHHPAGENWRDTFVVKDGVLRASYDRYDRFTNEYAHLFYKTPFSHYRLRLEYRFNGSPTPGGEAWTDRNSGVMIHSQAPQTMGLNQSFPVSIEVQLLGANGEKDRSTANVCSPGTTVSMNDAPVKVHCLPSGAPAPADNQWARLEIEVQGGQLIRHIIDGRTVAQYSAVRLAPNEYGLLKLDPADPAAKKFMTDHSQPLALNGGYIALQGESTPIEFRQIEIQVLGTNLKVTRHRAARAP